MPIIRLAQGVRAVRGGETVVLLATDPAVAPDLVAWCEATGNTLLSLRAEDKVYRAVVQRQPSPTEAKHP